MLEMPEEPIPYLDRRNKLKNQIRDMMIHPTVCNDLIGVIMRCYDELVGIITNKN